MEKDQFVATEPGTWWLVERDVDYRIEEKRRALGESHGWSDPMWYSEPSRLEELYRFLEAHHHQLLLDLDYALDDEKRIEWLDTVIRTKSPATHAADVASPHEAAEPEVAGTWDADRKMLCRIAGSGAYEFAFSDDQVTVRPGTHWMSQEQADGHRPEPAERKPSAFKATAFKSKSPAPEPAAGAAPVAVPAAAALDTAVQEVLSQFAGESGALLAGELGLTEHEAAALASDPEFERMVAEEAAQLIAQSAQ